MGTAGTKSDHRLPLNAESYTVNIWLGFYTDYEEDDMRWIGSLGPLEHEQAHDIASLLGGTIGQGLVLYAVPDSHSVRFCPEDRPDHDQADSDDREIDPRLIEEGRKLAAQDRELDKEREDLLRHLDDLPDEDRQRPEVQDMVRQLEEWRDERD